MRETLRLPLEALPRYAFPSVRSLNMRVSGYDASHLRPNPRYTRTSDTRRALDEIERASLLIFSEWKS